MILRSSAAISLSLGLALAPLPASALAPAATAPAPAATTPAPGPATTPPADANLKRAEELFINGQKLYNEGSYEAAILAFQESYELSKLHSLLFNIGSSYERLGDFVNARRYLDQYRAFAPEKERETLSRRIQALDQRQREKEQRERDAATKANTNANNNVTEPQPQPQPPPTTDTPPKKKDRIYGPLAIGLTAGVAVGLGLGVGFGIKASGEKNSALDGCMKAGDGTLFCSDSAQSDLDKRKTSALVADIGFAVAGAAAIALIAVIAVKASRKPKEQPAPTGGVRTHLAPYANPRGAGLNFGVRF